VFGEYLVSLARSAWNSKKSSATPRDSAMLSNRVLSRGKSVNMVVGPTWERVFPQVAAEATRTPQGSKPLWEIPSGSRFLSVDVRWTRVRSRFLFFLLNAFDVHIHQLTNKDRQVFLIK